MVYVKFLHVLFVFIWVGNLLSLTRLLGYHSKLDDSAQLQMGKIYRRMYQFVGLPSLFLALIFGSVLMMRLNPEKGLNWFLWKMLFAFGLVFSDFLCGHFVVVLTGNVDHCRGIKYKVLHGVCGLFLIGVLASIYLLNSTLQK